MHRKWCKAYFVEETVGKTQHFSKCIKPRVKYWEERCSTSNITAQLTITPASHSFIIFVPCNSNFYILSFYILLSPFYQFCCRLHSTPDCVTVFVCAVYYWLCRTVISCSVTSQPACSQFCDELAASAVDAVTAVHVIVLEPAGRSWLYCSAHAVISRYCQSELHAVENCSNRAWTVSDYTQLWL